MPTVLGIPLIGFVQMLLGTAVVLFVGIKYLTRKKKNKKDELIINDVHLIVGDGTQRDHQNVYIKKGVIAELSDLPIEKKNVRIIDGAGKTLMPGLIDSHVHIQGGFSCRSEADSDLFLSERMPQIFSENVFPYGVTTVKDLCAPKHFIAKLRQKLRSGEICGPELLFVGPNFTAPDGHPANTLGSNSPWARSEMAIEVSAPEQVTAGIAELKRLGVDFLKLTYQGGDYLYFDKTLSINRLDRELMRQIIREGNENGLKTTAHVFRYDDVKELLEAGIYGIEHGILDRDIEPDDPIVALWKSSGAHFVPTVNAMNYEKDPARMAHSLHNLKVLYDAGIPIAMGTDNMLEQMSCEADHRELEYYVEAGLSPMQAIVLAVKNGAEHLGLADRKGLVKPGMDADLILLDRDPAENISNIKNISAVFSKGRAVYSQRRIGSYDVSDYSYPEGLLGAEYESADDAQRRVVDYSRYESERIITQITYRGGEMWASEEFTVERNLSATKWSYLRPSDGTDLFAEKDGEDILLTGTFKGKRQDKSFRLGDGLWYQMMELCFPAFVRSELDEMLFYPIGTGNDRGAMTLGEFAAKKIGTEEITVGGKRFSCVKISLVLTMFSWAWTGLFWVDTASGQPVQSGVKKGGREEIQWRLKELRWK